MYYFGMFSSVFVRNKIICTLSTVIMLRRMVDKNFIEAIRVLMQNDIKFVSHQVYYNTLIHRWSGNKLNSTVLVYLLSLN